ncbi:MAG: TonB-dependent receptor [Candidatus Cyclobacteriaceae bacterium M2_1C_046]
MRFFLLLIFCLFSFISHAQRYTLNGYVRDADNGEELIGVTVYVPELQKGVVSNAYGFYSLTLPEGTYSVRYSFIGYETLVKEVELDEDLSLNVELIPEALQIKEVVVKDKPEDANVTDINIGREQINIQQVKKLPALFGEPDIIKAIQLLPGVISAGEGTSSFFVRGGSADQNLILIDEAPVYDPSHLFGLFSVFNADIIKDSELYKGGIPAQYGGRLSSILDVRTKDGNNKELAGVVGVGTLAARVMLEGPIEEEKSSFIISARRSYVDAFLRLADEDNLVHFYDINAKVNWRHSNNNRFFVAFYAGRDVFNFEDIFGFDWGNTTATFRWNHLFNDRLFSNTSVVASNFDYGLSFDDPVQGFEWVSNIQEITLKEDLNYFLNPQNELDFGYHVSWRKFSPGEIFPTDEEDGLISNTKLDPLYALDHAIYVGNKQKISDNLSVQYGIRLSIFQNIGEGEVVLYEDPQDNVTPTQLGTLKYDNFETIKTYINPEPRISARYLLNKNSSLKLSYNRMVQNTHLIASGTVPLPFNTWHPSSFYLEPQIADQFTAGYFRNFKENNYEFSTEIYYKDINNVTDFADNAQLFFNENLSTEFRQGDAWSYGLELMLQKNQGNFNGFVSYTLSKAMRQIPGVNNSEPFVANYDRRHAFSLTGTYDYSERWTFGMNFTYSTGRPITIPAGSYIYNNYNVNYITERNGYRLPDYHRIDLSATLTPLKNKERKIKGEWVFSIYNVYSRKNPFTVYTRLEPVEEGSNQVQPYQKEARLIYLFPILPSVTYNLRF